MPDNTIQTIQNNRARFAYNKVSEAANALNTSFSIGGAEYKITDLYTSYIKKLPMLIKVNGLAAALAFVKSKMKPKNEYSLIYEQISQWLRETKNVNSDLVEYLVSIDSREYRSAGNEIMSLLNWMKRFSEAMIKESDAE